MVGVSGVDGLVKLFKALLGFFRHSILYKAFYYCLL